MKADINTPLSFSAEVLKRFYLECVRKNEPAMEFRAAILEYPAFNIELDLNSVLTDRNDNKHSLEMTYCVRRKSQYGDIDDELDETLTRTPNVDWNAEDWECQLMLDMYQVLKERMSREAYDLRSPENMWNWIDRHLSDNERFVQIGAWKLDVDGEHYCNIAYIDTSSGYVIYTDPFARIDRKAQETIQDASKYYKKNPKQPSSN